MAVWLAAPSARDNAGTFPLWRQAGYKLCVWRDPGASAIEADHVITGEWRGAYFAINRCMEWAFANDQECDFVVFAGDDTLPAAKDPRIIAFECARHFGVEQNLFREEKTSSITVQLSSVFGETPVTTEPEECTGRFPWSTFGVCQPTGDKWGDRQGPYIDRVAGSPFVGREFARRINGGRGVFWEGFGHMFGDECLQLAAQRLGVFWQRPDLTHHHQHWGRPMPGERMGLYSRMPDFLKEANSPEEWRKGKSELDRLRRSGFAGYVHLVP